MRIFFAFWFICFSFPPFAFKVERAKAPVFYFEWAHGKSYIWIKRRPAVCFYSAIRLAEALFSSGWLAKLGQVSHKYENGIIKTFSVKGREVLRYAVFYEAQGDIICVYLFRFRIAEDW